MGRFRKYERDYMDDDDPSNNAGGCAGCLRSLGLAVAVFGALMAGSTALALVLS